jgi:hypothetical protein
MAKLQKIVIRVVDSVGEGRTRGSARPPPVRLPGPA